MIDRRCSFLVVTQGEAGGQVEPHLVAEHGCGCRCRCGRIFPRLSIPQRVLAVALVTTGLASIASADTFTYSWTDRYGNIEGQVYYWGGGGGDKKRDREDECGWGDGDGLSMAGPFEMSLTDGCEVEGIGGESILNHSSDLAPDVIILTGMMDGAVWVPGDGDAYAAAESAAYFAFTVSEAIDIPVVGEIDSASGMGEAYVYFELNDGVQPLIFEETYGAGAVQIDEVVSLQPGVTYEVHLDARAQGGYGMKRAGENVASFELTFGDGGGTVDQLDLADIVGGGDGTGTGGDQGINSTTGLITMAHLNDLSEADDGDELPLRSRAGVRGRRVHPRRRRRAGDAGQCWPYHGHPRRHRSLVMGRHLERSRRGGQRLHGRGGLFSGGPLEHRLPRQ
jgi:hypothetical protein